MSTPRGGFVKHGGSPRRRTRAIALVASATVGLVAGALSMPVALATISSGERSTFVDVDPRRILDTRSNLGLAGKLASSVPRQLQVTGSVPVAPSGTATVVPSGATGVVLNVTAVKPTRAGFVAVRPGNPAGAPSTSNLNVPAGAILPNQVTVGLPANGKIQLWYQGSGGGTTDLLVDVVGYYDNHIHDDRYLEQSKPIVVTDGVGGYSAASGVSPSDVRLINPILGSSADGTLTFSLSAPVAVGGTAYELSKVEFCALFNASVTGQLITSTGIIAESFATGAVLVTLAS